MHKNRKKKTKKMRFGPRPLWLHMANASNIAAQRQDSSLLTQYAEKVAQYSTHAFKPERKERFVLWEKDGVKAYTYEKPNKRKPRVLMIPSLINRHYILDLLPEYSFFEYMVEQGLDPVLIDWGEGHDAGQKTLTSVIETYVLPLMQEVLTDKDDVLLGYCMGGVLLLAALQKAEGVAKQQRAIFMATPWDFSQTDPQITIIAQNIWMQSLMMQPVMPHVPVDMLQAFFGSIDPDDTVMKYINVDLEAKGLKTKLFIATEDWLNDGRMLSWDVFKDCLRSWYIDNETAKNTWECCGQIISPKRIINKSLCVMPQKDKLVAPKSAERLLDLLPYAESIKPALGHIGLLGSTKAKENVWNPIVKWIKET